MVLGRLTHYAVDAVLISTVLAGIKKSTGFGVNPEVIGDNTFRGLTEKYLSVGESVFDMAQGLAINSSYFKREGR